MWTCEVRLEANHGGGTMKERKELTEQEINHIQMQLDHTRRMVRTCSDERMPQGPCKYCLEVYRAAINQAINRGLYE